MLCDVSMWNMPVGWNRIGGPADTEERIGNYTNKPGVIAWLSFD